jgi:glycosyltransferase involved in cell wall biosynthesis
MYDISIITPTFNRAQLLPRVWKSLLLQRENFEWIVIDDGSTDNTRDVIEQLNDVRITYSALGENSGVNVARNAGVKLARGRYVVFLDSDDELYPDGLETMIAIMDAADYSIGIAGFAVVVAETGRQTCELIDSQVLSEHDIVCDLALREGEKFLIYRKEVFDEFRLPDAFQGCEQIFIYEISKKWKFLMKNKPLRIIHRQGDNLSDAKSIVKRSYDIAKSYEIIIENHAEILAEHPNTEFEFLKKALYRYGVAGSRADAVRIYQKIVQKYAFSKVPFATILLLFCLLGPNYFEIWRIDRLNRKLLNNYDI